MAESVNAITASGLTTKTLADRQSDMNSAAMAIYGSDINLGPSTPDGQWMAIFQQCITDVQNLITQVNAMFDPDQAIGVILDARCAINGIQRQAGTFTVTNITVIASGACSLPGLDQAALPVYTVADNAGNQWQLINSQVISGSGTYVYAFQSATPGANATSPNTITTPVSIVVGVTSINNPTTYTTLGLNEETDAALKLRRAISVSISGKGYYASLLAALSNVSGVSSVFIEENTTGSTNADGVTGHSIWVIVSGTGASASIAQAIYTKRNAGCGMVGSQTYNITQADGTIFTVKWDVVIQVALFTQFTLTSLDGVNPPKIAAIQSGLASDLVPALYATVNINQLGTAIQQIDPNALVTSSGFSTAITQILTLSGTAASGTFILSYNGNSTAAINWNDVVGTIQTKVQAVAGLSAATVTGSIASHTLTIALGVNSALGLITANTNSLLTGGSAAITFSYSEGYANTLTPATKQKQFALANSTIVILPIVLASANAITTVVSNVVTVTLAIAHGGATATFTILGGYGAPVYSMQSGAGSINASTGVYTSSTAGTDVVLVTDALGNTATCSVTVS